MTWLSRLLSNRSNLQRLAYDNPRAREIQRRRRRTINLEHLETRRLLSNVTVSMPTPSSPLTITGDVSNDNFVITELANGKVRISPGMVKIVPGVGIIAPSTINGTSASFTTSSAVATINVTLPGTTNFDYVLLQGQGMTQPVTVKNVTVTAPTGANLNFTANKVYNSGNLVVTDKASPAPPAQSVNGVLTASVSNSSFAAITITQVGGGPDFSSVTLTNNTAPTGVVVSLGTANGDKISLTNNNFGPTTLIQGNGGPSNANSLGNNDTVTVNGGSYKSLSVDQLLNGSNNSINVKNIVISPINPTLPRTVAGVPGIFANGVWTKQGNGAGDWTSISGVTVSQSSPPINLPLPRGIGWSNITVIQGSGASDYANVDHSAVPGWISISQADVASNSPYYNTANISDSKAGSYISITQGDAGGAIVNNIVTPGDQATISNTTSGGDTSISQGKGSNDSAKVSYAVVGGNLSITQNDQATNVAGNYAKVTGSTVTGSTTIAQGNANGDYASIDPTVIGGNAIITQGTGSGNQAYIVGDTVGGNASITQADLATNGSGNTARIEDTTVGGDATISQGDASEDDAFIGTSTIVGGVKIGRNIVINQGDGDEDNATILGVNATGGNTPAVPSISVSITQGSGNSDHALIESVVAHGGNVSITQHDDAEDTEGTGNTAEVIDVVTGTVIPGPYGPTDVNGLVTITQGDSAGDIALVQGGSSNNIVITQGDAVQVLNGSTIASDVAEINDTTVTSDITIIQGTGNSTADDSGNYVAAIAFDYLGLFNGDFNSGSVTAGGSTLIQQAYSDNQVYLGFAWDDVSGSYFTTTFLDVYTGDGGGALAFAANTTVVWGPLGFFGAYTFEGGGSGNTYYDGGGNDGVTVDPDAFNS